MRELIGRAGIVSAASYRQQYFIFPGKIYTGNDILHIRTLSDHGGSFGPVEGGRGVIYNNVQAMNGDAA